MERVYRDCQAKQICFLQATDSWFGDPCRGVVKYLEIEYQCFFKENRKNHLFQEGEQLIGRKKVGIKFRR